MQEDDSFVALGPAGIGFECRGANIDIGADMRGRNSGLYAQGLNPGPDPPALPGEIITKPASSQQCKMASGS